MIENVIILFIFIRYYNKLILIYRLLHSQKSLAQKLLFNVNCDRIISLPKDHFFACRLLRNVLLVSVTIVSLRIKSPSCGNKEETDKPGTEIIIVSSNIAVFVHSSGGTSRGGT